MNCKSVLIVDDDNDLRENVAEVLESEGYQTSKTSNGKEALNFLLSKSPEDLPGCILLDISMPVMDGITFLKVVRNEHPELYSKVGIFIWSAKGSAEVRKEVIPNEVRLLKKPVDIEDLLSAVEHYCGKPS